MPLFVTTIDPNIKKVLENRQDFARMKDTTDFHSDYFLTGITKWYHERQSFARLISNAKIETGVITMPVYSNTGVGGNKPIYSGKVDYSGTAVTQSTSVIASQQIGQTQNITYDSDIRNNWILSGGIEYNNQMPNGFTQLYSSDRNVPLPGITEISVQNKGAFGSTREAKIKYICHTIEQLEMLEMLYMTLGVFCVLEWGWSLLPDGSLNTERITSDDMKKGLPVVEQLIREKSSNSQGHYDAMMGKISGFNWSNREGGGYECETTLISMAGAFLSMDTKSSSRGFGIDDKNAGDLQPISNIKQVLRDLKENILALPFGSTYNYQDGPNKIVVGFKRNQPIDGDSEDQCYITWGAIEDFILTNGLGMKCDNHHENFYDKNTLKTYLDSLFGKNLPAEPYHYKQLFEYEVDSDNKFGKMLGASLTPYSLFDIFPRFNSFNTKIFNDSKLYSADPTICILPGQTPTINKTRTLTNIRYGESVEIDTQESIESRTPFMVPNFACKDDIKKGYIRNICVNLNFIEKKFEETDNAADFVIGLLNEISAACGEPWKFGTFVDERISNTIMVVDHGMWDEKDPDVFLLSINGFDSIVRSSTINTDVDAKMATQIMYGTNKEPGAQGTSSKIEGYGFWGRSVIDQTFENMRPVDSSIITSDTPIQFVDVTSDGLIETLNKTQKDVTDNRSEETVAAAKQALHNYLVRTAGGLTESDGSESTSFTTMLPVKLSATIDGLSGLVFGNALRAKPIPKRYNDCWFTITNVSHALTGNDWTTTLETVLRIRLPKDKSTIANKVSTPAYASNYTSATRSDLLPGPFRTIDDKNPWDVRPSRRKWVGEIGVKSQYVNGKPINKYFIVFDKLENGIRAGMSTLYSYFVIRKLNTVQDIIWTYTGFGNYIKSPNTAPETIPNGDGQKLTDTKTYVDSVVSWLNAHWKKGTTKDTKLKFSGKSETNPDNIKMFKELNKIIVKMEHRKSYTPELVSAIDNFNIATL